MSLPTPLTINFAQKNLHIGYMQMFCDTDEYSWYCYIYLGGDPANINVNWMLMNGLLTDDPDTTHWTDRQTEAKWINVSEMKYKGWNGTQTVVLGSLAISGSQILLGADVPANSLGDNGDFYLNTTNGDYYKKVASIWGSSLGNLTGPQGIQGIPGASLTGDPNSIVYFNTLGIATDDIKLTAFPIDQFGRPQIKDNRQVAGVGPVFKQGSWQADGDPTNQASEGIVLYGPNENNLLDASNGGYARIKPQRFGLAEITPGINSNNLFYYFKVDPTSFFIADASNNLIAQIQRGTRVSWFKKLNITNQFGYIYHVYPGGSFATIQAAINQAVTDGHTSAENSWATIVVHGAWTEDITLKDGISLIGASEGKGKDYTSRITGQLTYTPQSSNPLDTNVTIANLFIIAGAGKNAIKLTGVNKGRIFLKKCYINKTGGTDDIILMNGHNSSVIEADDIDGNITSVSTGCAIYNILNGTFQSFNSCLLSSSYPGKILNCGANGVVNAQIVSSCTGSDAITIAVGGKVTLALSSITNNQANSNGANIVAGGQLISLDTLWNVPSGTGKAIFGVAGSVWVYSFNTFVANKNYSTAIGAGAIKWTNDPVAV